MSNTSGVPITYVRDPGVTGVGATIVSGGTLASVGSIGTLGFVSDGTMAVRNDGSALTVVVAGGTVNTTVSFSGTINANIGDVQIRDVSNNFAVMPTAATAKDGTIKALVVQHIDPTGTPLYQSTQVAVMNAQGTLARQDTLSALLNAQGSQSTASLALDATQQTGNAILSVILTNQGTQATSNLALNSTALAGNDILAKVYNAQGTVATNPVQTVIMNSLGTVANTATQTVIMNAQGTQSTTQVVALLNTFSGTAATAANQMTAIVNGSISNTLLNDIVTLLSGTTPSLDYTLFNAVTGTGASASVDVSPFNRHTLQHIVSNGTVNLQIRTSLDGIHWHIESVSRGADLFTLTGHTKYISANLVNGSSGVVVTTMLHCGQPDVGSVVGGGVSSTGTTSLYGGFSSALSQTFGATYDVNVDGYNGIGFHVVPPTGGQIDFEGSYDGINWTAITLREIGADGYTQRTSVAEDFIGSIACLTKIRFRTSVGGSSPGSVGGRMTVPSNTLEGVEHGNPPHLIGYPCVVKAVFCSGSSYNLPVWVPATGKRAVVTDVMLTVDSTAVVTLSDGAVSLNDWIIYSSVKVTAGDSKIIAQNFRTPHVTHQSGGTVYITQTAGSVTGVLHGYEIPA